MYLEMAMEEDRKMAESWKADADGILIFVCLYLLNWSRCLRIVVERFIFRCRRIVDQHVDATDTEPPPKPFQQLNFHTFPALRKRIRLGELTLDLELGDQSHLCNARDLAAAMGTKISQGHSVTLQSA